MTIDEYTTLGKINKHQEIRNCIEINQNKTEKFEQFLLSMNRLN